MPKNTTSRTQPLDAGIIKLWKVKTRKKLLQYVCSKVNVGSTASDIVKSVNLLQAIQWGKLAWDEVSAETITKCFTKVGLYPDDIDVHDDDDDPFDGDEFLDLQEMCAKLTNEC